MIDTQQIRAARGLLDWSQAKLSEESGLSRVAINNIEKGNREARVSNLQAIQAAFENAGIQFIADAQNSTSGGVGVRLKGGE